MAQKELRKKLKFYHANKCYKYKPESVSENEMHKNLWDYEIQMDLQIQTRRQDQAFINKKKIFFFI